MDRLHRRAFLRTTSAAAAATTATAFGATGAGAEQLPQPDVHLGAPAVALGMRELRLAMPWAGDVAGFGDQARRLARSIETATGGRYRFTLAPDTAGGLDAVSCGAADVYYGTEHLSLSQHPAFAYFAGLPGLSAMQAHDLDAWLTLGGGQMLWDELAAGFGVKSFLAGHTGPWPGLWSRRPIDSLVDVQGARILVLGLAREVVRGLGAEPVELKAAQLGQALSSGEIMAVELGGGIAALAAGIPHAAKHVAGPGIAPAGTALSFGLSRALWDSMPGSDQAIFAASAVQELHLALAEVRGHERVLRQAFQQAHGVRFSQLPDDVMHAVSSISDAVVAHAAGFDGASARINASYMGFRKAVTGLDGLSTPVA